MTLAYHVVTTTIRFLTDVICRVDDAQLERVPKCGPLILIGNHVNFMEAPVLFTHLQPRRMTGFAKAENWDNPLTRTLANLWQGIPLRRGEADVSAFRQALAALDAGYVLGVTPEGTRSGHGRLQRGRPGVTLLALRTCAAVLPLVCYGHEMVWKNLARLRRTDFHIVVGQPFHLVPDGRKVTRLIRQHMVDEIMYQMAALLPARYRGAYADLSAATETYLRFPAGAVSNLSLAQD